MLDFLHIENIAVIKKLNIDFGSGFNVLTGETGAGKSIIIDSINMLLGAKISKEIIRHGEDRAVVSAFFSGISEDVYALCDEYDIPYDKEDTFTISRTLSLDGRSTVKINSSPASLSQLKVIAPHLINIHGQNENHSFMDKSNHIKLLDEFSNVDSLIENYSLLYSKLNSLRANINKLLEESKQKDTMADVLNFQVKEITSAKLKDIHEEEKLLELRNKLKSAEKIAKSTSTVYKALLQNESGISAVVLIDKAIDALNRLNDIDSETVLLAEKLSEYKYEIEDIAEKTKEIGSFDDTSDPQRQLDEVEDRLTLIQRLERKYGGSIESVLKFKSDAEDRLRFFENSESQIEDLKTEYKNLYTQASKIAENIHQKRVDSSIKLSKQVKEALQFLDMPKVNFEIRVNYCEKNGTRTLNSLGYDDVEFMIATNVGEELSSMNKIASGGELARIMLALKSALSDKNGAQTVIFDEIDTGVSGSTSQKIGIKLAKIAMGVQTFCVTHSAQIASLATNHYFIKKTEVGGRAETSVLLLNEEERVNEVARIISGIDRTSKQLDAAKELILQSKQILNELI